MKLSEFEARFVCFCSFARPNANEGRLTLILLTVMVQHDLVEHAARGFAALITMNDLGAEFLKGQSVRDGLRSRLDGEFVARVADGEALTVHCADAHAPLLLGHAIQLRDVRGGLAVHVVFELVIQQRHVFAKGLKVGHDQVVAKDFGQEARIAVDDMTELLKVERN